MPAYSMDLRVRVARTADGGMPQSVAARTFGVGRATVPRWVRRRRATGDLAPSPVPGAGGADRAGRGAGAAGPGGGRAGRDAGRAPRRLGGGARGAAERLGDAPDAGAAGHHAEKN